MKKLTAPRLSLEGLFQGKEKERGRAENERETGAVSRDAFLRPVSMETPRLRLRRLRMRDAEDLYEWSSSPEVARYVLWDAHQSMGDTRAYLRYIRSLYRQGRPASWGIELKETGRVIGTIGIMAWNPEHRVMEVGYSLGQSWWHRGYAAEALACLLNLLFSAGIHRVEGVCDTRNTASARVMEKCGMKREGLLRKKIYNKGEYVDVFLYAALAEDCGKP